MIGQKLGHFRMVEKIGAGGMGVVYRAHDEQLDRDVAIKVLPAGTLNDDTTRKRFRQEALTLSKLNHPNIGTLHEFDTDGQTDYLVMEYVAGTTLSEKLTGGPLPEKEILRLGMNLAEGLAAAHEQSVIHRDLKPSNLRLTVDGRLKILDFGLAKLLAPGSDLAVTEPLTEPRGAPGTLPYMAPEQVSAEPPDLRSDLYAAGAVLYEMATGQRLFARDTEAVRLLHAILYEAPRHPSEVNPHVSPGLESIILKCLEKKPEYRYQSAKELLADLRRLEAGAPVLAVRRRAPAVQSWILGALALVIVLAVAFALLPSRWRDRLTGNRGARIRSLAVLPLDNLSGDPEQDYFADGMTDALITDLGQIGALRVISRTSVVQYKGGHKPAREIAQELNVDALVEGSVSRSGRRVRVTARLIQAGAEAQLWSQTYDRDLRDVLALQDELAGAIVKEIRVALTEQQQARLSGARRVDPEAQEAYLKGNYLTKGTYEQRRRAAGYFERAIQIDPDYAPAYAGLADYYWSNLELPSSEAIPKAKKNALMSLKLDPYLAHAHRALGTILFYGDWDWSGAEKEFKRAIELNPSDAEAHRTYSLLLSALGNVEGGAEQIRDAQQLDPLFVGSQITAGWVFYYARQFDRAIEQCQKALDLNPNSVGAHDCLGSVYIVKGTHEQAIAHCEQAVRLSGGDSSRAAGLARAYALAGRKSEAEKVLRGMKHPSGSAYVPPYLIATVYAALGEREEAFAWLEKAYQERDRYLAWLKVDCALDPVRDDPRFEQVLRRVGLPPG